MVPSPVGPDLFQPLDPGLAGHIHVEEDDIGEPFGGGQIDKEFEAAVDPIQFIIDPYVAEGKFEKRGLCPVVVAHDYFNRSLHGTLIGILKWSRRNYYCIIYTKNVKLSMGIIQRVGWKRGIEGLLAVFHGSAKGFP